MNIINRLFGRSEGNQRESDRVKASWESPDAHAFDSVQEGERLLQAGQLDRSEVAFRQGVEAYRKLSDNDGVAFALGRLGNFYRKTDHEEEALRVLREGVSLGTDIPAIYADLMVILASRGEGRELFQTAEEYKRRAPASEERILADLIHLAVNKAPDSHAAEDWLTRIERWSEGVGQHGLAFAARGHRGRLYEETGQMDRAIHSYEEAVTAGSSDRLTITRLLMAYEKAKRWDDFFRLAEHGLSIQHDAAWELDLRKRIDRGRTKTGARSTASSIPAFAIRQGPENVQLVAQIDFSPAIGKLAVSPDGARAFLSTSSMKEGNLLLYDLESNSELWRATAKKASADVLASVGRYFAITEEGRIGDGSADVVVFDSTGRAQASISLPDKLTEARLGDEQIMLGCRDGNLYCYDFDGSRRWAYHVQARADIDSNDVYQRPCPYFLSLSPEGNRVLFSSWDEVFALDDAGRLLWKWKAESRDHKLRFSVPLDTDTPPSEYFRALGLPATATMDEIRQAFRRRAFETHPDHHPTDLTASEKFKDVVRAYEALSSGSTSGQGPGELTIEISMMSGPNTIYGLAVGPNGERCAVTSSDGYLTFLDGRGVLLHSRVASEGMGMVSASHDLSRLVYAYWGGLNFYGPNGFANVYPAEQLLKVAVREDGERTAAWHGRALFVFDGRGRLLTELEFAKNIGAIALRAGNELLVTAGKLIRLRI